MKRIYLDTNAFYFFFFAQEGYSEGIKGIFAGMQKGKYLGITSAATLEELAYVTLMRLIEKRCHRHPSEVLGKNRTAIADAAEDIREMFEVIYSIKNLEIKDYDRKHASLIPIVMAENLLLPQDSIHLQTMKDNDCSLILSTDKDFDGIYGIRRIKPEEV